MQMRRFIEVTQLRGRPRLAAAWSGRLGERQIPFEVIAVDMIGRPWQGFDRLL